MILYIVDLFTTSFGAVLSFNTARAELPSEQSEREGEAPSGFAGLHAAGRSRHVEGATQAPMIVIQDR
jgi:hypothetical protein